MSSRVPSLLCGVLCLVLSRAATFTVTSTNDTGAGSLRQAITDANASAGTDTIAFGLPAGQLTIRPASALPGLTDPVVMDGTTQPGYSGLPIVELSGVSAGTGTDGLRLWGGNSTLRGLVINRFGGDGIEIATNGNNGVEGCYVGLDVAGTSDQGNTANGIRIVNCGTNRIGGSTAAARNVLSGNNSNGIEITGTNGTANHILGNYIGTDATGTADLGNSVDGVYVNGAPGNTVGGAGAGEGNLVSGNNGDGVEIAGLASTQNQVLGNRVGTAVSGTGLPNNGAGVQFSANARSNFVGNVTAGAGNLLAFNAGDGVYVNTGTNNAVRANAIHSNGGLGIDLGANNVTTNDLTDADTGANQLQNYPVFTAATAAPGSTSVSGTLTSVPNRLYTLDVFSSLTPDASGHGEGQTYLGSTEVVTDAAGAATFSATLPVAVQGRYLTATATDPAGNTSEFCPAFRAASTIPPVTFTVTTTNDTGPGSLRQALLDHHLTASAANNTIAFNLPPGTVQVISPATALPLVSEPVTLDGFTQPGARANTLAVGSDGVWRVQLDGNAAPNGTAGLRLEGPGHVVRGLILTRFKGNGIELTNSVDSRVAGNLIGVDAAGTDQGQTTDGVRVVSGLGNRIGGLAPADRNIISGNNSDGIEVAAAAEGTVIEGNYIGTDAAGTLDVGNGAEGVLVNGATNTVVGGTATGAGNLLSGNNSNGIQLSGAGASGTQVLGNKIGTAASGTTPLPNSGAGVQFASNARSNFVGGVTAGAPNLIAFNGGDGIFANSGTNNTLRANAIHSNGGLGIDLGANGVTANDAGDADTGANQLINFPVVTNAIASPGSARIQGTYNGRANAPHALDFYSNPAADPSGSGEGQRWLGSADVTTDGAGDAVFDVTLPVELLGRFVSATATDAAGNTSEFGPSFRALSTIPPATFTVTTTNLGGPGSFRQALLDGLAIPAQGPHRIQFNIPGSGARTLAISNDLPRLTEAFVIDGFSQPGASPNTLTAGNNAQLLIHLDGSVLAVGRLPFAAPSNVVQGIYLTRMSGSGLDLSTSDNVVEGCIIGLSPQGTNEGSSVGILVGGSRNRIGGLAPASRTVVSGNYTAIQFEPTATEGVVQGCFIGTGVNGTGALQNYGAGIHLAGTNHVVGGTAAGAGNVVCGNAYSGILVLGQGHTIQGNRVGLDLAGAAAGNYPAGITLQEGTGHLVGGLVPGSGNLVSANLTINVKITGTASNNVVQGNFIGTGPDGVSGESRSGVGIWIETSGNRIGGSEPGAGNTVAYVSDDGIWISAGSGNAVRGNRTYANGKRSIGLSYNFTVNDPGDADTGPNDLQNFPVLTAANGSPGGTTFQGTLGSQPNTTYQLDFYSSPALAQGDRGEGRVYLGSGAATTDGSGQATFTLSVPGILYGRQVSATATSPGGSTSEQSLGIAATSTLPPVTLTVTTTNEAGPGSLRQALLDAGTNAAGTANWITFNLPGTNVHVLTPTSNLPVPSEAVALDGWTQPGSSPNSAAQGDNAIRKIILDGTNSPGGALNFARGGNLVRGLILRGFSSSPMSFPTNAGASVVEGCVITNNYGPGVLVQSAGNRIGGTTPAARNILSGNNGPGLEIEGTAARDNLVQGNYIGSDPSGLYGLPNNVGVWIDDAPGTVIGGSEAGRNIIGGNNTIGLLIYGTSATNTVIQGNHIGATPLASNLGNEGGGVRIDGGAGTLVGEPLPPSGTAALRRMDNSVTGLRNLIAFNQEAGVTIQAGSGHTVRGNHIFGNAGLGLNLDLVSAVTENDLTDSDTGPNGLQNFPLVTNALITASNVVIQGTLNSRPGTKYRIDFYSNVLCDPSGHGEGQHYLGSVEITTDLSGNAVFLAPIPGAALGEYISCTATDPGGSTSEFSACTRAEVQNPPNPARFTVTVGSGNGPGSLPWAIGEANGVPGVNGIDFAVDRVDLAEPLEIASPVQMDGTRPGSGKVVIRGARLPEGPPAILLTVAGNTLANFQLIECPGDAIQVNSDSNILNGLILGGSEPGQWIGGVGLAFRGATSGNTVDQTLVQNPRGIGITGGGTAWFQLRAGLSFLNCTLLPLSTGGNAPSVLAFSRAAFPDRVDITFQVTGTASTPFTLYPYVATGNPVPSLQARLVQSGTPASGTLDAAGRRQIVVSFPLGTQVIAASALAVNEGRSSMFASPEYLAPAGLPGITTTLATSANFPMAARSGDPVNLFTGELIDQPPPDLDLGGPLPLVFQRYYASFLQRDARTVGRLGLGWLHNFEGALSNRTTTVEVVHKLGRVLSFTNAAGTYQLLGRQETPYQLVRDGANFVLGDPTDQRLYIFGPTGLLAAITDGRGNTQTLAYTGPLLSSVSDGAGRTLTFQYSAAGFLTNVADGTRSVGFVQVQTNLVHVRNPLGKTSTNLYTGVQYAGLLVAAQRPLGNAPVTHSYDNFGRVIHQIRAGDFSETRFAYGYDVTLLTDPDGFTHEYFHEASGNLMAVGDPTRHALRLGYNAAGQRNALTDREGAPTTLGFHAPSGQPAALTNADGTVTRYTYTSRTLGGVTFHDLTQVTHPDGTSETLTRDARGNVVAFADAAGQVTRFGYNARSQLLAATNPTGGVIDYAYHADGTLATLSSAESGLTRFGYDALKRLTNVVHGDGTSRHWVYDANDRLVQLTDERGLTAAFAYDDNDRLRSITHPDLNTLTLAYDNADRLVEVRNELGAATTFRYDRRGNLQSLTDPDAAGVAFGRDSRNFVNLLARSGLFTERGPNAEDATVSLTNGLGQVTRFAVDPLGCTIGLTNPLGQATLFARDALRRITNVTDPLNRRTAFSYDAAGRLTSASAHALGAARYEYSGLGQLTRATGLNGETWHLGYSPLGRRTSLADPLGRTNRFAYDLRGRRTSVVFADGTTLTNSYDGAGNVVRRRYSTGPDLTFAYDARSRLTNAPGLELAYDAAGRVAQALQQGFAYTAEYTAGGRLSRLRYHNGALDVLYSYNGDRLGSVQDTLTSTSAYFNYDEAGRVTHVTCGVTQRLRVYDSAGRLVELQDPGVLDLRYTYDAAGQVLQATGLQPLDPADFLTPANQAWTFDAAHQLSTSGYGYDARGRLVTSPGHSFAWDGASRLVGVDGVTLGYNGLGEVITRTAGPSSTRYFRHPGVAGSPILAERNETTSQVERYYIWTPEGRLLYQIEPGQGNAVRFHHFDRLGSTVALSDLSGQVTDSYAYSPYGELLGRTGTNNQPFLFLGAYGVRHEPAAGLYQMGARYYDPVTARFLSRDPVWPVLDQAQSLDPYQYALQNPLRYVDPSGLQPEPADADWVSSRVDFPGRRPQEAPLLPDGWDAGSGPAASHGAGSDLAMDAAGPATDALALAPTDRDFHPLTRYLSWRLDQQLRLDQRGEYFASRPDPRFGADRLDRGDLGVNPPPFHIFSAPAHPERVRVKFLDSPSDRFLRARRDLRGTPPPPPGPAPDGTVTRRELLSLLVRAFNP